jgi:hypothetical protein
MLPSKVDVQALPPPPGVMGSIRAGFDAITAHIGLILMPLALDLLLWLGPHLGVSRVMQPILDEMSRMVPASGAGSADFQALLNSYIEVVARFNLLGVLRTLPIGVPSLMSGRMPVLSPLGQPTVIQVGSATQVLVLLSLFVFIGWVLGGLYLNMMSGLVVSGTSAASRSGFGRIVVQTMFYSLICLALIWTVVLPALTIILLTSTINALLGQAVLLLIGFIALWLLVPLFFSPHGIYLRKQNALASFLGGFQLTRLTLPSSSLFVLTVFLVGVGLNYLWAVPAEDSWLVLVGLLGHAFISAALLASSFIYYQDMSIWLQTMLEHFRASLPTQKA